MKILTPTQVKTCDDNAIKILGIESIELMEEAAKACVSYIKNKLKKPAKTLIFCGKGNNGGDGLAIARLLTDVGYLVETYVLDYDGEPSRDFMINSKAFKGNLIYLKHGEPIQLSIAENDMIIDAILGNGLNRPISDCIHTVVSYLNKQNCLRLAIDIPTGMYANAASSNDQLCFKADVSLSFERPKLNFMMKEQSEFVGRFELLEIGWPQDIDKEMPSDYHFTTKADIAHIYKKRAKFSSKHDFGHALIVGGSYGKVGAAVLATKACIRSGAGLTSVYAPICANLMIQMQAPEAMFIEDPNTAHLSLVPARLDYKAIGIGPGIGTENETGIMVKEIITQSTCSLVIDADAINLLALDKDSFASLKPNTILTPHAIEFERMTQKVESDAERIELGRAFATKYSVILLLKGAHTAVILPDGNVFFNSTGNPALAKGGSGDVLTGIITGLLSSGYSAEEAAKLGVYVHGLAADVCTQQYGMETITASDIIEALKEAFFMIANQVEL